MLWLCKSIGFGESLYYVAAVKIMFSVMSLLIPWGMYVFGQRHWGEQTARLALLLGVFWYELVGFAHKPMTEFVATSLLVALLAVIPLSISSWRRMTVVGALCALIMAVRLQYAPPVGLLFIVSFWAANKNGRLAMLAGATAIIVAVGALEMAMWGAPFHSYRLNMLVNLAIAPNLPNEDSSLMLLWLLLASGGLIIVAAISVFGHIKRRGFVVLLMLLIIVPHMLQNHHEYRFIFATIPLWLMLFADFTVVGANRSKNKAMWARAAYAFIAVVSILGIFNLIPFQKKIYASIFSRGQVNFIRNQNPIFKIYEQLSADESVRGLIDSTHPYSESGGYYYFHHSVPFYDSYSWLKLGDITNPAKYASHIITSMSVKKGKTAMYTRKGKNILILQTERGNVRLPTFVEDLSNDQLVYWDKNGRRVPLPNYTLRQRFAYDKKNGKFTLWKSRNNAPVREWKSYKVIIASGGWSEAVQNISQSALAPPPNNGVEFEE